MLQHSMIECLYGNAPSRRRPRHRVSGPAALLTMDPNRQDGGSWSEGRLAFYTKRQLDERWTFTASLDTEERPLNELFRNLDRKDPSTLFRRLDPVNHSQLSWTLELLQVLWVRSSACRFFAKAGGVDLPEDELAAIPLRALVPDADAAEYRAFETTMLCHGEAAAAGMDRNAVGLADQSAARVGDEAGEIVALAEDRRARGARHHPAHLVRDMVEPVLHQCKRDGIEVHGLILQSFTSP